MGADYGMVMLNFTNTLRIVGYLKFKHTHICARVEINEINNLLSLLHAICG